jgi:putative inorganic carbon (HCO3(-)) transporter
MKEEIRTPVWSDWLALGLVAATAPIFLFPRPGWTWVFMLAPMAWMLRLRGGVGRGAIERTPLDWGIGLLAMQIAVSCVVVPNIELSLPKVAGTLLGIIIFYSALAVLSSEKIIKTGMIFLLAAGSALAVFGVLGVIMVPEQPIAKILPGLTKAIPWHNWKLPGAESGINPNALAGSLCFVIPLALVLLFAGKARAARIVLLGMVSLVFLAVMFLLQAVSVWLALFISLGLVGMKKKKRLWIAAGGVLILGFFLFSRPARTVVREKFEIRYGLWSTGVTAVQRHPLLGVGMDRLRYDPGIGYELAHAHNQLIHTAAELGIPGLAAYLAILIGAGWMCLDVSKRAKPAWMRDAARGLGAGQLAFLIFGMGDAIPLGGKNGVFFWVSLALIAAMYNYVNRRSEIVC